MSIFFDGNESKVDEGEFIVVYQEAKVLDGENFLINVSDNKVKKIVKFEACSMETTQIYSVEWEYAEFDKVFRFNPDLMNPNKREGRYHWIIERLVFCSDGRGDRKLAQGADCTDDLPQIPVLDNTVKIPTGRMPYAERAKLREDMTRLDKRREDNIAARREATRARFMRWLKSIKDEYNLHLQERQNQIDMEREQRLQEQIETRRRQEEERLRLKRLNQERLMRIEAREEDRRNKWNQGIKELKEEGRLMEEQRQQEIEFAEEKRRHELEMKREKARQEAAKTERLEAQRERNFKERQHRQWKKAQAWLLDRAEQIKVLQRNEEVRMQKRLGTMHSFNLARSRAYEDFMEKKRAREQQQNNENAYDWLEIGGAEGQAVGGVSKDDEQYKKDQTEAKQSRAREQLEEQRRRAKLQKQREKIFQKSEKKRNVHEVERHEKVVEKHNSQVTRDTRKIAEVVQAWRERQVASQAKEAQEKHERKRREKLRAENIQRRYEEDTTLH